MSYLALYRGGKLVTRHELTGPLVIGRAKDADLTLADIRVSRHHCRIEPEAEGWAIVDLGSRNGTHLRDQAVQRHAMREGDQIAVGETVIHFHTGKMPPMRPPDPGAALEAMRARGEAGREERIPDTWKGPLPKPQARPDYPGQALPGSEDVPTGSTLLGYRRDAPVNGVAAPPRQPQGPPPEMKPHSEK